MNPSRPVAIWPLLLAAVAMMMITMGAHQSTSLFISPLCSA